MYEYNIILNNKLVAIAVMIYVRAQLFINSFKLSSWALVFSLPNRLYVGFQLGFCAGQPIIFTLTFSTSEVTYTSGGCHVGRKSKTKKKLQPKPSLTADCFTFSFKILKIFTIPSILRFPVFDALKHLQHYTQLMPSCFTTDMIFFGLYDNTFFKQKIFPFFILVTTFPHNSSHKTL